ncbi:MAG: hypothetical protein K1X88_25350 [Nannocystaceae bacterium]|nr:hypothetical protein [Nannocystaceae bacterium]
MMLATSAALLSACKRKQRTKVVEVWDDEPVPQLADAIAALAPPWPAPTRGILDNGLVSFWLHEADSPAAHVRLLLSTRGPDGETAEPEIVAIVAETLRFEWQRRLQRHGAAVRSSAGPDRIEISASAHAAALTPMLAQLGSTLAPRSPAGLEGARERLLDDARPPAALETATSATVLQLLGHAGAVVPERLREPSRAKLHEQWQRLVDPAGAVLVAHAGADAESAKPALRKLADPWRGDARREPNRSAVARLQRAMPSQSTGMRLLSAPAAPLHLADGPSGTPTLVLGRTIALPDAKQRALARLAQRVAQEELDASIVIAGECAVWIGAAALSRAQLERDVPREVSQLATFATTRQPRQRLFQAAQLWLGARVVEASSSGEDWTRLFAQAIDLSRSDTEIAGALARDAAAMLETTPEALEAWTRRWLDPRTGEPGWAWSIAGLDEDGRRRVGRIVPLTPA